MSQQGGRLALHVISMHERKEKGWELASSI
jgi:hypothetical protein